MSPARVLLIEDEAVLRTSLAALLRNRGYEVREAASAAEALACAAQFTADVAIADLMLRDQLNGLELLGMLRDRLPAVRAVLITGFPSEELRDSAEQAGVAAFLEKPFTIQQLAAAIDPRASG
jgi:CheY-like chemotaxis protein